MAPRPMIGAAIMYALGLGASAIEYGPRWVPLFLAVTLAAAAVGHVLKEHPWRKSRSRAGRSTTGSR